MTSIGSETIVANVLANLLVHNEVGSRRVRENDKRVRELPIVQPTCCADTQTVVSVMCDYRGMRDAQT